MSTSACSASGLPASSPNPGTTFSTPGRQSRFQRQLAEADGGERRLLGGLQHHGVADEQCRSDLPAGDDQRVVPRHDRRDHAERLAADQRQVIGPGGCDLVVELVGELGVVGDAIGGLRHVDARANSRIGLPTSSVSSIARCSRSARIELREAQQHALALLRLGAAPAARLERRARGGDCRRRRPPARSGRPARSRGRRSGSFSRTPGRCARGDPLAIDERASFGTQGRARGAPSRCGCGPESHS